MFLFISEINTYIKNKKIKKKNWKTIILSVYIVAQIGDSVQATMEETLINQYGVDFQHWINRRITEAWDRTQERVGLDF